MTRRWVIAGGGTGGHVTPALALAEAIVARGDRVLFIGSARGLESKLVPEAGFDLEVLPSEQFMGRNLLGQIRGGFSILRSVAAARRFLSDFEADLVVSVGGYAAMPTALAAWTSGCPLFVVEPNAIPGRVNRFSARFARTVFVGFESTLEALPSGARGRCVGVPLRRALQKAFAAQDAKAPSARPLRLLVFGGSQGAHQLNENVPDAIALLPKGCVEVFHQTGDSDRESVTAHYEKLGVPAEVVAFEFDMPKRYRWADLAICRAGALTVAELALAGMPALLVPYPFAADDHQSANARALEDVGAALRLEARPLDVEALARTIGDLVASPTRLLAMREAASRLARPNAADEIIDHCIDALGGTTRTTRPAGDEREGESCSAS